MLQGLSLPDWLGRDAFIYKPDFNFTDSLSFIFCFQFRQNTSSQRFQCRFLTALCCQRVRFLIACINCMPKLRRCFCYCLLLMSLLIIFLKRFINKSRQHNCAGKIVVRECTNQQEAY